MHKCKRKIWEVALHVRRARFVHVSATTSDSFPKPQRKEKIRKCEDYISPTLLKGGLRFNPQIPGGNTRKTGTRD